MSMSQPIRQVKGATSHLVQLLDRLHLHTTTDLLFHLPRGYEDRSRIRPMGELALGQSVLLEGMVQSVDFPPGKRPSLAVQLSDGSGRVTLRFYAVYPGLKEKFTPGRTLRVFGEVRMGARGFELYHPEFEAVIPGSLLPPSRLTAIYPATEGLSQARLRKLVDQVLHQDFPTDLPELLPLTVLPAGLNRLTLKQALTVVHQPPADAPVAELLAYRHPAQVRLIFEELVAHQVSLLTRRQFMHRVPAPQMPVDRQLAERLLASLPFAPTQAQRRVWQEIEQDLTQPQAMLRLVQGDVGAGKTLVAALAAAQALSAGWQVAIMAPTEILAEQHFANFTRWFEPLGVQTAWLSGKQKGRARQAMQTLVQTGAAQIVIGTHALFQDEVEFDRLGLVVIDEQHRFGVDQRLALREKGAAGLSPHQLIMTATPIPRTLAMSAYGDLDTSIIDELPPGRTPVTTVTVPNTRRDDVIERLARNCATGRQAYWVCTLVEESEALNAEAAEKTYADLCERLPTLRVGLVHGRQKPVEKQAVMAQFKAHELDLLVATTVIEVGVDVTNASLMIIDNAERLGLSQLHQLRGRVGRGATASFCVLLYQPPLSATGIERLSVLRDSTDGFVIAEKDLALRGPGELLGTRQTGLLGFRVAQLQRDHQWLEAAQAAARQLLDQEPEAADALLTRWLPQAPRYARV